MHLTGPDIVVVPVNPTIIVPITCLSFIPMTFKSTFIHSKDSQSQAIVEDPDPLDGYKKNVFDHLQHLKPSKGVRSRIRYYLAREREIPNTKKRLSSPCDSGLTPQNLSSMLSGRRAAVCVRSSLVRLPTVPLMFP